MQHLAGPRTRAPRGSTTAGNARSRGISSKGFRYEVTATRTNRPMRRKPRIYGPGGTRARHSGLRPMGPRQCERVEALAANPGPNNEWLVQLFASPCAQNFSEHLSFKRAYENQTDDAPLLAWRARATCSNCPFGRPTVPRSRKNARRVYEDAGRDVRGIYDAFIKWETATAPAADWLDRFATAQRAFPKGRWPTPASSRWSSLTSRSAPPRRNAAWMGISA